MPLELSQVVLFLDSSTMVLQWGTFEQWDVTDYFLSPNNTETKLACIFLLLTTTFCKFDSWELKSLYKETTLFPGFNTDVIVLKKRHVNKRLWWETTCMLDLTQALCLWFWFNTQMWLRNQCNLSWLWLTCVEFQGLVIKLHLRGWQDMKCCTFLKLISEVEHRGNHSYVQFLMELPIIIFECHKDTIISHFRCHFRFVWNILWHRDREIKRIYMTKWQLAWWLQTTWC